jgi:DNA-binding MarR family transcriptional regulator
VSSSSRDEALGRLSQEVRAWQVEQEMFDAALAELAGLNRTDWRCLDLLTTRGPMTAGQLSTAAHLTTGAVTAVVDHLEAAGYVRRVGDPNDRRRVIVEPTEEVGRRAAVVFGPLIEDDRQQLAAFDAEQLATIIEFVRLQRVLLEKHTARVHDLRDAGRGLGRRTTGGRAP